jgi:transcription initiation factor TFIIA large subunit
MASHVADFEIPTAQQQQAQLQQQAFAQLPYPSHAHYVPGNPYSPPPQPSVKSEPVDSRYILNGPSPMGSYALPPLPGPQLNGAKSAPQPLQTPGQQSVLSFPPGPPASGRSANGPPPRQYTATPVDVKPNTKAQSQRIPQVDGPSSSSGSQSPSPSNPRSAYLLHPSLSQPASLPSTSTVADDEAINSDLDDSSSDEEEETVGETDIVFCTYDKVCPLCPYM